MSPDILEKVVCTSRRLSSKQNATLHQESWDNKMKMYPLPNGKYLNPQLITCCYVTQIEKNMNTW
jgi:hypothetical protein